LLIASCLRLRFYHSALFDPGAANGSAINGRPKAGPSASPCYPAVSSVSQKRSVAVNAFNLPGTSVPFE